MVLMLSLLLLLNFSAHSIVGGISRAGRWGPIGSMESRIVKVTFFGPGITLSSCTGTLITDKVIVTAAHCLSNSRGMPTPSEITYYKKRKETFFSLNQRSLDFEVVIHPEYLHSASDQAQFDIGLIVLKQGSFPMLNDDTVYHGGDGRFDDFSHIKKRRSLVFGTSNQKMTSLSALIVNATSLHESGKKIRFKTKSKKQLVCKGDSGGPLIQYHRSKLKFYGVVSRGIAPEGDCSTQFAITFIDESMKDWIGSYL